MIEQLNTQFGRDNRVQFTLGQGNLPKALLRSKSGSTAELYLYGAHVTSWKTPDGVERLFLSSRATFGGGKAIRGGIPLIFPQFGGGTLPSHGFARNSSWNVTNTCEDSDTTSITLELISGPELMRLWGHEFRTSLTVELADGLELRWLTTNTGRIPLTVQKAFHTYYPISHISKARVLGLANLDYLDNTRGKSPGHDSRSEAIIDGEVDRVYIDTPDLLTIIDDGDGSRIEIEKRGARDAVLWNPWVEKSKTLADLQPQDYERFLCLEAGAIHTPLTVAAGSAAECSQRCRFIP